MAKKKHHKAFWHNIKFKYKLTIFNENTLEEVVGIRVSKLNGVSVLLSAAIVIFLFAATIIAFTPLRNYLPGYMNSEVRSQIVNNALKLDSLQQVVERQTLYILNIQDVFKGTVRLDTVSSIDSLTSLRADTLMAQTDREREFRRQYEENEKYNLTTAAAQVDANKLIFFCPIKGMIASHFDAGKKQYGTEIIINPNESILAAVDGTVVLSTYTADAGYVIQLQHNQDFMTIYKHCGSLLRKVGDKVRGGEAIALTESAEGTERQSHLHFELWQKGRPLDAEKYIVF